MEKRKIAGPCRSQSHPLPLSLLVSQSLSSSSTTPATSGCVQEAFMKIHVFTAKQHYQASA